MTTLQTVCIFIGGYLVSRLLLRAQGHELFVAWLTRRSVGRVSRIVLGVMLGAFALSTFVPNALTVLALIPVVAAIRRTAGQDAPPRFPTLLAMAVVYGGNIGGLGSVVGSPANLYLLANLRIFHVAGREALHFVSWLTFGMPLALSFLLLCWGMLLLTERRTMQASVAAQHSRPTPDALFPLARGLGLVWGGFWVALLLSTLVARVGLAPRWRLELWGASLTLCTADLLGLGFTLLLAGMLFLVRWPVGQHKAARRRLLGPGDLAREVPLRGVLFGVGVLVLLVLLARSGVVDLLGFIVELIVPRTAGPFLTLLVLVLITIYATEVLSNTAVATVLFPLSRVIATRVSLDPLTLMLAVSLASTCAFMTPVATPVNALAFAGIGDVSLSVFLKNGALANLLGGGWIATWIQWLVPPVLAWFR